MNRWPDPSAVVNFNGDAMLWKMRLGRSRHGIPVPAARGRAMSRRRTPCTVERLEERLAFIGTIALTAYDLAPNTANQTIDVMVSGGDIVQGVDLDITTGDGGPSLGGSIAAPAITAVNLFPAGGVFTANHVGQGGSGQATGGQFFDAQTLTASGNVTLGTGSTAQLLATVTIDTTGFFSGSYSISVGGTVNNGANVVTQATDFPPETSSQTNKNPNFTDGVLEIGATPAAAVSLAASANPVTAHAPVTFTAMVSGSGAAPTGTVAFFDGPTLLGPPVGLSGGTAMFQTSSLPAGANSILAQYSGDSNYALSTSQALNETVSGLSPALTGTLPTSVVAGTPLKGKEKLTLTAAGTAISGKASANILLSPDEAAADSVLMLASHSSKLKLKANKAASFNLKFPKSIPASIAAGSYHILIQFTDTSGAVSTIDSGQSLNLIAPVVDLTGSFVHVPTSVKAGKKFTAVFLVTNLSDANVAAHGLLPIDIETSSDGQLADATVLAMPSKHINLKPGKSLKVTLMLSVGMSTDLFVNLDPSHTAFSNDSDVTNNVFSQQIVVV